MKDLFAKCGCNCGRCPSYKENLLTGEDRRRCAEGWAKYIGYRPTPEKLRACVGCQAPDEKTAVRYQSCYVRKCALRNGVETCAHCSAYPCEDVPRASFAADQMEWFIKMSFGDDAGGVSALGALQSYTAKLNEDHGKGAFRYFSKADVRVLRQLSTARE